MSKDFKRVNRPSLWQRLLSYFYPLQIEFRSSDIHEDLFIFFSKGEYQLCTTKALYSYGKRYYNFARLFEKIALPKNANVLLLGLGLGSIPLILEKKFNLLYNYTAVEIDDEIVDLACHYITGELSSKIDYLVADAYPFLLSCHDKYDLIIMDIFEDNTVPKPFLDPIILQSFARLLSPHGLFIQNFMNVSEDDRIRINQFSDSVEPIFDNGTFIPIWKSKMYVSNKTCLK